MFARPWSVRKKSVRVLVAIKLCCVFPDRVLKLRGPFAKSTVLCLEKIVGKQVRQFRLRFEYSNVELQRAYRIE